jgi:hypothetical protein
MSERCPHCGAHLPDTADAFCPECRAALDEPTQREQDTADMYHSEIEGLDGLSNEDVLWELQHGGRFVVYQFCVSFLVVTLYRSSQIHFIRSNESAVTRGMKYTLLSLALGWWGIPFGPIFTVLAIAVNLAGGRNITPTAGMLDALRNA